MTKIANVALTNTFNTWRIRSNEAFDRLSQFAINNSSLYANTITANNVLKATGNTVLGAAGKLTIFNGSSKANGVLTVTNNLIVSGNSVHGAAGKRTIVTGLLSANGRATISTSFLVSGNTVLGDTGKKTVINGLLSANGRATISTSFLVSGNTVLGDTGKKTVINGNFVANTGVGTFTIGDQTSTVSIRGATTVKNALVLTGNTNNSNSSATTIFAGLVTVSGHANVGTSLTVFGNTVLGSAGGKNTDIRGTLTLNSLSVGFLEVPSNSRSANYTTVLADSGYSIDHPSTDANARTYTIPANASVAYPVGTCIMFSNMTSQVVTIAITTDTMYLAGAGTTGSRSLAQYGVATARKLTSTTWLIMGTGLT
jgi:hypothetical protein